MAKESLAVALNVTDNKGNRLSFNGKDIALTTSTGEVRNIGWIHEENGVVIYRKKELEKDRYRRLDAWSIPMNVLQVVDKIQYQSDARAYEIAADKAKLYGKYQREKIDLEEKVYVPVKAWTIFKSMDATEERRIQMFGVEWYNILHDIIWSAYMTSISSFLADRASKNTVYPPLKNLFDAFAATPYSKVKVVIMGNHPVMDTCISGLAFGYELPFGQQPEILHVQDELERERVEGVLDGKNQVFRSSDWAEQGCLMLNANLSIEKGRLFSHEGHWNTFVERVLRELQAKGTPIVFMFLGSHTWELERLIDKGYHRIIKANAYEPSFVGSDVFVKANNAMKELGYTPINW